MSQHEKDILKINYDDLEKNKIILMYKNIYCKYHTLLDKINTHKINQAKANRKYTKSESFKAIKKLQNQRAYKKRIKKIID
jgi:hypothetical protein